MEQQLKDIISACDLAIQNEDFDTLMNYYSEDAVLVVKPGMIARGKEEIKKAFITIANYFNHHIVPTQGKMILLEAGDTVLVLSQTLLDSDKKDSEYAMERRATYVFKKNAQGKWLCVIDNSYGTDLIGV
ncbi:YybH family protein [Bacillus subtilis]|uniref:YybH family protein n=1 Tax=Bacillus subtilis TaxID=1423 RepID=UPI001BAE4B80|nr:nuclear transport factor 2 family protein [Bacillus subtilis]MBU8804391.1 nuclear transport factor 2 family protein [Bacillus subtilis]MED1818081.1 nuclear transport factor 2 family protein [Bacillus subtilis]QWF74532.1 nuclear transport factor 2 family protein [Bacillus subtilis]